MEEIKTQEYDKKMIEAFIDKPDVTEWYQNAFSKFNINGMDVMKWHWSWWAFGGGFLFLLYRKQYLPALALFIASMTLGMVPFGGLLLMILSGGYATYFVYKGYKKALFDVESVVEDEAQRVETMRAVGGYHQWVIWVYILFMLLAFISFFILITPLLSR